jgi:hypothetical protein
MGVNIPDNNNLPPPKGNLSAEEWLNSDAYKEWESKQ